LGSAGEQLEVVIHKKSPGQASYHHRAKISGSYEALRRASHPD
jgi:hypothetical protein